MGSFFLRFALEILSVMPVLELLFYFLWVKGNSYQTLCILPVEVHTTVYIRLSGERKD
jgi:hypothetical protein